MMHLIWLFSIITKQNANLREKV